MFFRNPIQSAIHYKMDSLLKAFIIAEMILWSAWNLINPVFAIFVTRLPGGNVELAAGAVSAYMLVRVIVELIGGKVISKSRESVKLTVTILGMVIMSVAYVSLAFADSTDKVFVFYSILAFGLGLASPAKNSLFSAHLDKNKEPFEWGLMDAAVFLGMAVTAVVGGFIAQNYGFKYLFFLAAGLNTLGILPYLVFIKYIKK